MNICLDIGNSRIKLGEFVHGELAKVHYINATKELEDVLNWEDVSTCLISNSGDTPSGFLKLILSHVDHVVLLDTTTLLPFDNTYETPDTLGRDRIAAIAGANYLYADEPCFIIDAGTCITYDYVARGKVYKGGNIAPGLTMRLIVMHDYTAHLPLEKATFNENILGSSTAKAIQNGALYGILNEIEQYIVRLEEIFGNFKTILTGGDAQILSSHLKREIFVQPDLVLNGLYQILLHNAENNK